ncbi:MAG: hypothetical protein JW760_08085 [Spirochaetales bacterium]|nr:hypothetical protein [Spirochaetales bacterium]
MTADELTKYRLDELGDLAVTLDPEVLPGLVEFLREKDDAVRQRAFLLLEHRSRLCDDTYPFWDRYTELLESENSYHRTIGLHLMADNARWDRDRKFEGDVDRYLSLLHDEKPITIRQCIQALEKIVPYKPALHGTLSVALMGLDLESIRETMQKLVLFDILGVLAEIRKQGTTETMENYISAALSGGMLDKKSVTVIRSRLDTGAVP